MAINTGSQSLDIPGASSKTHESGVTFIIGSGNLSLHLDPTLEHETYSENFLEQQSTIKFTANDAADVFENQMPNDSRPDNLSLASDQSSVEALIEAATSTPLSQQGLVTRKGQNFEFVAENISEKIRFSSPPGEAQTSSGHSVSSSASDWSASSASSWAVSPVASAPNHSPEEIPPVDPHALKDLETHARKIADNVDKNLNLMMSHLQRVSTLTASSLVVYREGVENTCDSVDSAIKSMYALMAKCEEVSRCMQNIPPLGVQVKEISRLLTLMEAQIRKNEK